MLYKNILSSQFLSPSHLLSQELPTRMGAELSVCNVRPGRRKRDAVDMFLPDSNSPDSPDDLVQQLPGSLQDISSNQNMTLGSSPSMILSAMLVMQVLGLVQIRSTTYFTEICSTLFKESVINECEIKLFEAFQKYEADEDMEEARQSLTFLLKPVGFAINSENGSVKGHKGNTKSRKKLSNRSP